MATATDLAQTARYGLWPTAPWTVRPHPEPAGRQHPWLWACTTPGCQTGGPAVNEGDAHQQAAEHYLTTHTTKDERPMPAEFTAQQVRLCHEATEFDHECAVCTSVDEPSGEAIPGTDY